MTMTTPMLTGEAADFYALVRGSLAEDLGIEPDTSNSSLYVIAESEKMLAEMQGQAVTGIYEYLVDLRDSLIRPTTSRHLVRNVVSGDAYVIEEDGRGRVTRWSTTLHADDYRNDLGILRDLDLYDFHLDYEEEEEIYLSSDQWAYLRSDGA